MRLDHIAFRVTDRWKTANFFIEAFGYRLQTEFDLNFPDGSTTKCIALEPPEKPELPNSSKYEEKQFLIPWTSLNGAGAILENNFKGTEYHLPPELFVSDGSPDSIVGKWVVHRDGIGGIHHMAYQVESVENTVKEWKEKGYAEFASENVLTCPGLKQIFTKPSELTGVIYEFIERQGQGFCKENVQQLMQSSADFK